ncbi:MAG: hypothetical protein ACTSPG_07845 [Candidatus Hodarchaeales archaeon]
MRLDQTKLFYISLCVFFVLGSFVTAYVSGQQAKNIPDKSLPEPEYYVGYINNYINQKVNLMTLADIWAYEYVTHPPEPTGVLPLYPAQSLVYEYDLVNCSITDIETYIIPDKVTTHGTNVGLGLYLKEGNLSSFVLKKYQSISTAGDGEKPLKIEIKTPRITIGSQRAVLRLVITNFGTEISEAVFIPTVSTKDSNSRFYGINTVVDSEESLYLQIKNEYQMIKGRRYYVSYDRGIGIKLHEVTYRQDDENKIGIKKDEVVALFSYPTLVRKDNILDQYSDFENFITRIIPYINTQVK